MGLIPEFPLIIAATSSRVPYLMKVFALVIREKPSREEIPIFTFLTRLLIRLSSTESPSIAPVARQCARFRKTFSQSGSSWKLPSFSLSRACKSAVSIELRSLHH